MRFYESVLMAGGVIVCLSTMPFAAVSDELSGEGLNAPPMVGAYYFGGWAGRNRFADDPDQPWAKNAPTHLTKRMVEEFAEREPVWGWRDDSLEVMERQIDLAADHGLAFFAFCWYWQDDGEAINTEKIKNNPLHTGLELYLRARNNDRLKFCLLVANHSGFKISGADNWRQAGEFWLPYLTHKQYLTIGGRPLIVVFDPGSGDKDGFAAMQEAARTAGLPGLAIAGCWFAPQKMGFTHRTHYNVIPNYEAKSEQHAYEELVASNQGQWYRGEGPPYVPIVTAGWDKRPWEGPTGNNQSVGWYFPDRTPEQFAGFLRKAIHWMDAHPDQTTAERIVMVYAWNELGEGGYIVPTKGDPAGKYLKALQSVVMPLDPSGQQSKD